MNDSIEKIKNFICYNQKELIKYEYIISIKHKKFKDYLHSVYNDEKPFSEQDINTKQKEELNNLYEELISEAYFRLDRIMDINSGYIKKIFLSSQSDKLKVVIKTVDENKVVDIYRSQKKGPLAYFQRSPVSSNTGFSIIVNDGKDYYLNNNLKHSYLEEDYINPRLKPLSSEIATKLDKEIKWEDLWESFDDNTNQPYLSTLIIPMSISKDTTKSSQTDEGFENTFFKGSKKATLWGFLCIDHPKSNYFSDIKNNTNDDIGNIGYILADTISLYLMFFYNHITGSNTIKKYHTTL